jgi:hypothetical protein
MGTKDRELRDIPSRRSQRAAVREGSSLIIGGDPKLTGILVQLTVFDRAREYQTTRRGPRVRRDVPMRLVQFLADRGLSINTDENSATVEAASAQLDLSPGRIVELMHQVTKLTRWRILPQQVRCPLTHREIVALLARLRRRQFPAEGHDLGAARRKSVRFGQPRLSYTGHRSHATARNAIIRLAQPRGCAISLTSIDIVILLNVAGDSPEAHGSALPGARIKLKRARRYFRRQNRRSAN